jgi:acetyl esterase/lipase
MIRLPSVPRLALGVVAICATNVAHAQGIAPRRLAFSLPAVPGVRRLADEPYRSLAGTADTVMYGSALRYDVFVPPLRTDGKPRGGIVFIHGGMIPGTQRVSPKDDLPAFREWGNLVASAGLVGITFSHRLTTDENLDVAAGDVTELMRVVRARAAEWQLDPDRLCVMIFSAGGPLASPFLRDTPQFGVRCVAMYYPFLDTDHTGVRTPFRNAHTPDRIADLARYSPRLALLSSGQRVPPMLVARAGRDAIPGINASIERFVQAAMWMNAPLDLYIHPTGPHGFDMTTTADPRASEIVAATLEFFRRHLD